MKAASYLDFTDIQALVNNTGLASGDYITLDGNALTALAACTQIATLEGRGVDVYYPEGCYDPDDDDDDDLDM